MHSIQIQTLGTYKTLQNSKLQADTLCCGPSFLFYITFLKKACIRFSQSCEICKYQVHTWPNALGTPYDFSLLWIRPSFNWQLFRLAQKASMMLKNYCFLLSNQYITLWFNFHINVEMQNPPTQNVKLKFN